MIQLMILKDHDGCGLERSMTRSSCSSTHIKKKKKNYEEIKVLSFKYTFSEMSLVNTNVILDAYIASSEPVTVKSCREDGVPKGSQITRPGSFLRKDYNST